MQSHPPTAPSTTLLYCASVNQLYGGELPQKQMEIRILSPCVSLEDDLFAYLPNRYLKRIKYRAHKMSRELNLASIFRHNRNIVGARQLIIWRFTTRL